MPSLKSMKKRSMKKSTKKRLMEKFKRKSTKKKLAHHLVSQFKATLFN